MKTLVIYKSKTGFAKKYAQIIAEKLDAQILELDSVNEDKMSEFDTVIFGGGFYKGTLNGLVKAKELFQKSDAKDFIIFATGANPNDREEVLNRAWKKNLDENELKLYPHFYMQGGINFEKMDFISRITMKIFSKITKKKAKNEVDKKFAQIISKSCDISDPEFVKDLIDCVKNIDK